MSILLETHKLFTNYINIILNVSEHYGYLIFTDINYHGTS